MNKRIMKRVMSMCLVLVMILSIAMPVTVVNAAKEGDTQYTYETYTLAEINELCNKFEGLSGTVSSTTLGTMILGPVPGASQIGAIYKGAASLIAYDLKSEYKFYKSIRDTMIDKNYKKVKIQYTLKYSVYKMYWEKFYAWKVVGKKAHTYYI